MVNIELRQIRHLVVLARLLSFTQAAKELGITQSALTRSIQAVEARANVRLFDRDRGRVALTEVGKAYIRRAADLLSDAEDLDRFLDQTAAAEIGELQYAITAAVARAIMPAILTSEIAEHPQLRSLIFIRSPESMIAMVQAEEVEFCVCGEQPELPPSLRMSIIGTTPLEILVRPGHPLLRGAMELDLTPYPLILSGQMALSGRVDSLIHPFRVAPPQVIIDEIGTLIHVTAHSNSIWLTMPSVAAGELQRGELVALPLPDGLDPTFRIVLYSHDRRTFSPAARRLLDLMRGQLARLTGTVEAFNLA